MAVQDDAQRSPRPNRRASPAAVLIAIAAMLAAAGIVNQAAAPGAQPRPGSSASSSSGSFDELYGKGQQANANIKTLTARFVETTTSPLLTQPLVARGTLAVERPSRVVMRYDDPEHRVVLIDGDRMTMTWPSRGLRQVTNIARAQGRVQKYFANNTAAELRKEFDVDSGEKSERPGLVEVSMTPKRKQIKETLARLDLWVDPATSLLAAMRMTFAGGDTKLMEFHDTVPNAVLAPDTFAEPK